MTNHQDLKELLAKAKAGWNADQFRLEKAAAAALTALLDEREALVGENAALREANAKLWEAVTDDSQICALVGEVERLRAALQQEMTPRCFSCGRRDWEPCARAADTPCGREHLGGSRTAEPRLSSSIKEKSSG